MGSKYEIDNVPLTDYYASLERITSNQLGPSNMYPSALSNFSDRYKEEIKIDNKYYPKYIYIASSEASLKWGTCDDLTRLNRYYGNVAPIADKGTTPLPLTISGKYTDVGPNTLYRIAKDNEDYWLCTKGLKGKIVNRKAQLSPVIIIDMQAAGGGGTGRNPHGSCGGEGGSFARVILNLKTYFEKYNGDIILSVGQGGMPGKSVENTDDLSEWYGQPGKDCSIRTSDIDSNTNKPYWTLTAYAGSGGAAVSKGSPIQRGVDDESFDKGVGEVIIKQVGTLGGIEDKSRPSPSDILTADAFIAENRAICRLPCYTHSTGYIDDYYTISAGGGGASYTSSGLVFSGGATSITDEHAGAGGYGGLKYNGIDYTCKGGPGRIRIYVS